MAKVKEVHQESKDASVTKSEKKRNHGSSEFFVFVDYLFLSIFFAFLSASSSLRLHRILSISSHPHSFESGSGPSLKNFTGVCIVGFMMC